jgi:hypothetical protein
MKSFLFFINSGNSGVIPGTPYLIRAYEKVLWGAKAPGRQKGRGP